MVNTGNVASNIASNDQNINPDDDVPEVEPQDSVNRRKSDFIKKFISFNINKENGGGVEFINEIGKLGRISSGLKKDLESFSTGITDFELVDIEGIRYSELMSEVTKSIVIFNNQREELRKKVLQGFDITPEIFKKKVEGEIEKMEGKDLQNHIDSTKLLSEKLKDILGEKIKKKNVLEHFEGFHFSKERYNKLSDDNKDILASFHNKLEKGYKFSTSDFHSLFAHGLFNDKEKIEFVKIFVPTMSLKEAIKLGLINKAEAKKYKYQAIEQGLRLGRNMDSSEINIRRIEKNFSDKDIIISTGELLNSGKDALRVMSSRGESITKIVKEFDDFSENVNESSAKDVKWLKSQLEGTKKIDINSIQKLKNGNIIAITEETSVKGDYSKKDSSESIRYLEIYELGDEKGEKKGKIKLRSKGINVYDKGLFSEVEEMSYQNFVSLIAKGGSVKDSMGEMQKGFSVSKVDVYTPVEIMSNAETEQDSLGAIDIDSLEKKKKEYTKNLRDSLTKEKNDFGKTKYTKAEVDKKIEEDSKRSEYAKEISEAGVFNTSALVKKINEADNEGEKYGVEVGTTFQLGDPSKSGDYGMFTITGIDSGRITIKGFNGKEEEGSYGDFYQVFKKQSGKRTARSQSSFESTIEEIKADSNIGSNWSDFSFKKNKILKGDGKEDIKMNYNFLTSISSNKMIKINSINGDSVNFSLGEQKTKKKEVKNKEGDVEKVKEDSFGIYRGSSTVSLAFFETYIKAFQLIPRSVNEAKEVTQINDEKIEGMKGQLSSRLFNRMSLSEIAGGFKQGMEGLEEYLKEGNAEHSAQFAHGVFGRFLPSEVRADLKSRVEQSQKKNEDAYLDKLKAFDSSDATEMIEGWLLNNDAPQYKKSAGVLFLLKKYGVLYAKKLAKYKGSFAWYKALGGRVGDKLYKDIEADANDRGENFNEEHLVYVLFILQCKPGGYNGIQRRSRLHKDVKRCRATGKQEETETGRNDSSDARTVEERIEGGMGELKGGTYPNAIGWAENVINKGGSMQQMSKIPFVMAFSGIAYGFDTLNISDLLKNFGNQGLLIPITRFMSYKGDLDLLNKTVLSLSQRIESRTGRKYKGMGDAAQKIFNKQKNHPPIDKSKIIETEKFFDTYGEVLIRSLFLLNDGKTDEDAYLSKLIFVEKDDHEENGTKKNGNDIFGKYYNKLRESIDADGNFENEPTMIDAFKHAGISGIHAGKAAENVQQSQGGGFRLGDPGAFMWEEFEIEMKAIMNGKYKEYGEKYRREILKSTFSQLCGGLLKEHSTREEVLASFKKKSSSIGKFFIENGVDMVELSKVSNYSDLQEGMPQGESSSLIDSYMDNMLQKDRPRILQNTTNFSDFETVIDETQNQVHQNIPAANDES